jgi:hypothetical protein
MAYGYGAYPRAQRLGLIFLLFALLLICLVAVRIGGSERTPSDVLMAEVGSLRTAILAEERRNFRPPPKEFTFDPNTVTAAGLQLLGLSSKQAAGWLKFRGARTNAFRRAEDIGKLYVLSEDDKARLIPLARVSVSVWNNKARRQVQSFAFDPWDDWG